jgi:hypothetical protein
MGCGEAALQRMSGGKSLLERMQPVARGFAAAADCSNGKHISRKFRFSIPATGVTPLNFDGERATATILTNPRTITTCNDLSTMAQLQFN